MVYFYLFRPTSKAQAAAGTWWRYMPERSKERTVQVPAAALHIVVSLEGWGVNTVYLPLHCEEHNT